MSQTTIGKEQFSIDKRARVIKIIAISLVSIFLVRVAYIALHKDKAPIKKIDIKNRALRGSIISSEGYTISRSIKTYSASIHTNYLDPNKKDFFLTLFSIYTNTPIDELKAKFYDKKGKPKKGWITLLDNIDSKTAIYLKDLKYKLNRFKVFKARGINKNFFYGLTITEKGESREFPLKEALSPILGYTRSITKDHYTHIVGYNGIEKYYEKYLNSKTDGFVSGRRDAVGYVIQDRDTIFKRRDDGYSLVLNISLSLQKNIDMILDNYKIKLGAKEIIAAVMRTKDSKILAITSSNRYDPLHIKADEIENLQPKATTYAYEPGSVLKPLSYAIALEHGVVSPSTMIDTRNGKMWIGKYKITDDEPFTRLSAQQIIVKSSNIGISQIVWKLNAKEFRNGLLKFGLGKERSGIDIGREATGSIYTLNKLRFKVNRATTSYGYGIRATFAQLLKAYNVFNNNGISYSPRAVDYLIKDNGKKYALKKDYTVLKPISPQTANMVKNALIAVVRQGTGRKAITEGLEVGGKTGTAMIPEHGRYINKYHTSFFGFANDTQGNRYTIGVLVIEPTYENHFASQSAVPVFKEIVDALIDKKMLKPNLSKAKELERQREEEQKNQELEQQRIQRARELKERLKEQRQQNIKAEKRKKRQQRKRRKHKKFNPAPPPSTPDLF